MKSLLRKLIGRRARKIYLWTGICLATLTVLFYQITNWRGAASWKKAQARLKSEGELFTIADLVPARVPAEQNFFGTPALWEIAKTDDGPNPDVGPYAAKRRRLEELNPGRYAGDMELKRPSGSGLHSAVSRDFGEWIEYIRAAGTLDLSGAEGDTPAALFLDALDAAHGALFEELLAAAGRPHSRISPYFDQLAKGKRLYEVGIPHYQGLQSLAATLSLRAAAAAQCGDVRRVGESIRVLLKLSDGCRADPILIGLLVSMAMDSMCYKSIWEAVDAGAFDLGSLWDIEELVGAIDNRTTLLNAVRGELVASLDAMQWVSEDGVGGAMSLEADGLPSRNAAFVVRLAPSGWLDQNRSYTTNWYLDYVILPTRDGGLAEALAQSAALEQLIQEERKGWPNPHKILPMLSIPVIKSVVRKVVHAEAMRQLLLLACAVERYRLDTGSYPETIGALAPKYVAAIPTDPCSEAGDAMRYRKDGARYRLWSVALDRKDDGGTPGENRKRPTRDNYLGDWVWQFAE